MAETRVQKFKEYREEIQNSFAETDVTTKKKTSDRVEKILDEQEKEKSNRNGSSSASISFDELMDSYEIYDKGDKKTNVSPLEFKRKRHIAYMATAISVCSLLAIASLVVGILYFGGFVTWNVL